MRPATRRARHAWHTHLVLYATGRNAEGVRVLVRAHRRRGRMGVHHG